MSKLEPVDMRRMEHDAAYFASTFHGLLTESADRLAELARDYPHPEGSEPVERLRERLLFLGGYAMGRALRSYPPAAVDDPYAERG